MGGPGKAGGASPTKKRKANAPTTDEPAVRGDLDTGDVVAGAVDDGPDVVAQVVDLTPAMERVLMAYLETPGAIPNTSWRYCDKCGYPMPEPGMRHSLHKIDCVQYMNRKPPTRSKFA